MIIKFNFVANMPVGTITYDKNRLRDYSSLFSRSEVSRWLKNDWSSLQTKIERYDRQNVCDSSSYLTYLKWVYNILGKYYQNEYVYKNEFIGQSLLSETRGRNSILFNEFRLGKAVADLAIFNGVSRAYEVKTMLDKEMRLPNQMDQYRRLFNEVWLIVPEQKLSLYSKQEPVIGIVVYDQDTGTFSIARVAEKNKDIDIDILMQVLHTKEYVQIVEKYFTKRPKFDDFNKFKICKELIKQIPADTLNELFIGAMKQRRIYNAFSKKEPQFNQLFLSMNFSVVEQRQLLTNLRTPIC